jgi:peroxin-3
VLAILPTATENILLALPVEETLTELQRQKAERLARSVGAPSESDLPSISPSVAASAAENGANDETKSTTTSQTESYVHASQVVDSSSGEGTVENGSSPRTKKTKAQLWNEMKIGGRLLLTSGRSRLCT